MKSLLLFFILTVSFQSWANSDDIKDFGIEGMSINKSALDFMTVDEILNNTLPYFETKRKYYIVSVIDDLKLYDQVEIYLKSNDNKYYIKSINAGIFIDELDQCLKQKKKIVNDLDKIFSNIKKISGSKKHEADPTGQSKHYIDQYNLGYPNHIRVECTQFSKEMINAGLASNSLNVVVMTKEINDWVAGGYK
ncbi:hypothetical protein OAQ82_03275 [Candidatus Pelagibacter sp.]|jgi:hypothetical protein|nr:hypothetical protein [Candidatus Pelagibacter sp.]